MANAKQRGGKAVGLSLALGALLATASSYALAQDSGMFGNTARALDNTLAALAPVVTTVNGGPQGRVTHSR